MMIMIAQLMNSNNDNGDDRHLNNLLFILLDQEKSQVLSSGISKDLEIGSAFIVIMTDLLSVLVALNQNSAAPILMVNSNKKQQ